MLNENTKDSIRSLYADVTRAIPGYQNRRGQREMIGQVARVLSSATGKGKDKQENVLVIEGKTGTGKTIGYLIPALVVSRDLGMKLVISTATVALQEQIASQDMPVVMRHLNGGPVKFHVARGRGRFACITRLERRAASSPADVAALLLDALNTGAWDGCRDSFSVDIDNAFWMKISCDANTCTRKRCSHIERCPYYLERDKVMEADVVIANHDLVMSVIAGDSKLLPHPSEALYVFDEAHHLPSCAQQRFASTCHLGSALQTIERMEPALNQAIHAASSSPVRESIIKKLDDHHQAIAEIHAVLQQSPAFIETSVLRFPHGIIPDAFGSLANAVLSTATHLHADLSTLIDDLDRAMDEDKDKRASVEHVYADVVLSAARIAETIETWNQVIDGESRYGVIAKWIERHDEYGGAQYSIHTSPISAAAGLVDKLWRHVSAAVLTSATLSTFGDFDYYLKSAGLDDNPMVRTTVIDSPFDYAHQGEIVLPRMKSDPANVEAHTDEVSSLIPRLTSRTTGTLVLFASSRQMHDVYRALPDNVREMVLMQGRLGKRELLARHRERVESNQPSVIFGMASMGEGIDLPGALCEQVVICKIPFSPPDSPVDQALAEAITAANGDPFREVSLPKAALELIQWVGRLIRRETDHGRVVFLDRRIRTRPYGRDLLRSLPPFPVRQIDMRLAA